VNTQGRVGRRTAAMLFLAPALVLLAVLVVWPTIQTFWLSFRDANNQRWVGFQNYETMFTNADTRKAITNNLIWVAVAPALVTAVGLVFAVLTERIKLATALKTVLFVPMAISFLAAGVTWRLVYDNSPERGVLNAAAVSVHDTFMPPSPYAGARVLGDAGLTAVSGGGYQTQNPVATSDQVLVPLVGVPPAGVPKDAAPAAPATGGGPHGVVWLDFTQGGGGKTGVIDPKEKGLPGVTVEAVRDAEVAATTKTSANGAFSFPKLTSGEYAVRLPESNFAAPYGGIDWLGPSLVTPSIIIAYLWVWAGFATVLIAAGLAALPRDTLEAARIDGASEWQVFRRITVPLLRPVLVVVLVTLIINVLKIFDLIFVISPSDALPNSTVLAVQMYQVAFGGTQDTGLGSALGVLLLILVIPAMIFNIRRLRREST
jgi:ABC-type sugar transport systems, permease components